MGTSLAPNYANLFMDRFETKAVKNYHLKPILWKRFIDNIFMVWPHGINKLHEFYFGQFLRLRCICTMDLDFNKEANKLTEYYHKRGYLINLLQKHKNRASKYTQDELLTPKPKKDKVPTPVMVTQFNPCNPNIGKLIQQNWNMIKNNEELSKVFPQSPLIGFRRLPSISLIYFFIWGFYVAFNTIQVISQRVVGRVEETSTYRSSGFCTANC